MGCDIHLWAEGKRNGRWEPIGRMTYVGYWDGEEEKTRIGVSDFDIGRNYYLFSIMAGVRGYGDVKPIAERRGLPEDCCKLIVDASEDYGIDGHSPSFLYLKELQDNKDRLIEAQSSFDEHITTLLASMVDKHKLDDARIVFFFDN